MDSHVVTFFVEVISHQLFARLSRCCKKFKGILAIFKTQKIDQLLALYASRTGEVDRLVGVSRAYRMFRDNQITESQYRTLYNTFYLNDCQRMLDLDKRDEYGSFMPWRFDAFSVRNPPVSCFRWSENSPVEPVWTGAFVRYCGMMGRNDLRTDPRFVTPALRRRHLDEFLAEVQAWMSSFRSFDELEAQVSGGGRLAIGKVRSSSETLETEWAAATEPTYDVAVGSATVRLPKAPWRFDGVDPGALALAAAQEAHNAEILRELGLDQVEIQGLVDRGILGGPRTG